MASTRGYYQTKTLISGKLRALSSTVGPGGAYSMSVTIPALTTAALPAVRQFDPEVTGVNTNATVPAAPTTLTGANSQGWQSTLADPWVPPYADQGTVRGAQVFTVALQYSPDAAITAGQLTFTIIVFVNNAEMGRGTAASTAVAANMAGFASVNINLPDGYVIPAGARLATVAYVSGSNLSATTALTIALATGAGNQHVNTAMPVTLLATRNGAEPQTSTDAADRVATTTRVATDSTNQSDAAARLRLVTRTSYQGDGDPPITNGTKRIAGTVYIRANGARYTTGATVVLIRDRDGREVATTQSGADGTYSFVRDAADPETYTTRIKSAPVGNLTEEAVSQSGLVPA